MFRASALLPRKLARASLVASLAMLCTGGCAESGAGRVAQTSNLDAGTIPDDGSVMAPSDAAMHEGKPCLVKSFPAEPLPLEMLALLDSSSSMRDEGRWDAAARGMMGFADTAPVTKLWLAMSTFPYPYSASDYCNINLYTEPLVPMSPAPAVAEDVKEFFNGVSPGLSVSPLRPALDGAVQYLRDRHASSPFAQRAVVVVTDGMGNRCGTTDESVIAVATWAQSMVPPIPIFVLSIESGDTEFLERLAQAGGTAHAYPVNAISGIDQALASTIQATRDMSTACVFSVPTADPYEVILPDSVRVQMKVGDAITTWPLVDRPERCAGGTTAFYYDNNEKPSTVTLCPAACDAARSQKGQVTVEAGCVLMLL